MSSKDIIRRVGIAVAFLVALLWFLLRPGPAALRGVQIALVATTALALVVDLMAWVLPPLLKKGEASLHQRFRDSSTYRGPGSGRVLPVVGPWGLLGGVLIFAAAIPMGRPGIAVMTWVSLGVGITAFVLHRMPNHSRTLKYNLAIAFLLSAWLMWVVMNEQQGIRLTLERLIATIFGKGLGVLIVQPLFVIAASLVAYFVLRPNEPLETSTAAGKRLRVVHRMLLAIVPYLLVTAIVVVGIPQIKVGRMIVLPNSSVFAVLLVYVIVRFYVIHRLAYKPVLYLRSFGYAEAPKVFSKVVAPAVSHEAVIAGLVHSRQLASELMEGTHPGRHARLYVVPDERWQQWVGDRLRTCAGAIIDDSVGTSSVEWEVERALESLPPERVLLIRRAGSEHIGRQAPFVEYDLKTNGGVQSARVAIRQWVQQILDAT